MALSQVCCEEQTALSPCPLGDAVLGEGALLLSISVAGRPEQTGTQTCDGQRREECSSTIAALEPKPPGSCSPPSSREGEEVQLGYLHISKEGQEERAKNHCIGEKYVDSLYF